MSESRAVVLMTPDLMMISTVSAAAAQNSLPFRAVTTPQQLEGSSDDDLIVVDLATPGLSMEHLATTVSDQQKRTAIVFGPHVQTERFEEARAAGFEQRLARGRFNAEAVRIVRNFADAGRTV